jgi:PHP family Zn ribbon phosphoesterase
MENINKEVDIYSISASKTINATNTLILNCNFIMSFLEKEGIDFEDIPSENGIFSLIVVMSLQEIKELENKLTKQFPDKKINISPYINFKNSKIYIN